MAESRQSGKPLADRAAAANKNKEADEAFPVVLFLVLVDKARYGEAKMTLKNDFVRETDSYFTTVNAAYA